MHATGNHGYRLALIAAFAVAGGSMIACGGAVLPEPSGDTGGASSSSSGGGASTGGGSQGGGTGASSGSPSGPSSGGMASSGGTGSTGASSSGVVSPPPQSPPGGSSSGTSSGAGSCSDLPVPTVAEECSDGSYATGQYVDEGGQCVLVFSCPTSPSQPVSPPSSPPSMECTGALPDICEVCSDGTSACAHYVVENGECVVQICSSGGGINPGGPIVVSPPATPIEPDGGVVDVDAGSSGCTQGASCDPGSGCGGGSTSGGCSFSCECSSAGTLECTTSCGEDASAPVVPSNPVSPPIVYSPPAQP